MRYLLFFLAALFLPVRVYAADAPSRYFMVKLHNGVDAQQLSKKISFGPLTQVDVLIAGQKPGSLSAVLDALYLETGDILDIHLYNFKVNLEVFSTKEDMRKFFRAAFNQDFDAKAFYITEKNTLYGSLDTLDAGVIAHELAHAMINRYFVVNPPEKLQEVMCGYVEYTIKKKAGYVAH